MANKQEKALEKAKAEAIKQKQAEVVKKPTAEAVKKPTVEAVKKPTAEAAKKPEITPKKEATRNFFDSTTMTTFLQGQIVPADVVGRNKDHVKSVEQDSRENKE